MSTHDGSGRDLVARLDRANEEIDRLHMQLDRWGNVVRFRVTRYVESLDESAADLNARQMPPADTYELRKLERDLGSLGDPIEGTGGGLGAGAGSRLPRGPERGDGRRVRLGHGGRAGERPQGDASGHPVARRRGGG